MTVNMMKKISRQDAIKRKLKRYFTGIPCSKGHVTERFVTSACCKDCAYIQNAKRPVKGGKKNKFGVPSKEYRKKYFKEWHDAHREYFKKYCRDYHLSHKEKRNADRRIWAKNNPEKSRIQKNKRRALKRKCNGTHTAQDILYLKNKQNNKCVYCKKSVKRIFHVDHKIALSKGGSNGAENLQILCPNCNQRKNTKSHEEFLKEMNS